MKVQFALAISLEPAARLALAIPVVSQSGSEPGASPLAVQLPVLKWQHGGCYSSWCETGWYSSPAVADLDGDGTPEVIGSAYSIFVLDGATGVLEWQIAPDTTATRQAPATWGAPGRASSSQTSTAMAIRRSSPPTAAVTSRSTTRTATSSPAGQAPHHAPSSAAWRYPTWTAMGRWRSSSLPPSAMTQHLGAGAQRRTPGLASAE